MLLHIIPLICPFFFLSKQIFCYKFLSFYETQSLQIFYTHWEWSSILWDRKQNLRFVLPSFSFFPSLTPIIHSESCDKYFSRTGFCNLVQVLWTICCFMWKRTRFLLLILPFSFSPIFRYQKLSSLFSQGLSGRQSWNLVQTWTVGWCIMYLNQTAGVYLFLYFFIFFSLQFQKINFLSHFSASLTKLKLDTHMGKGLIFWVHQI